MIKMITQKFLIPLLITTLLSLQACAPKEIPVKGMKIGMHIDAVLEFAVEYPLAWAKERRLSYGSSDGEVRWINPEETDVLLRIFSANENKGSEDLVPWLKKTMPEYPDLTVTSRETTEIPAGEALHLQARTTTRDMDVYKLAVNDRNYKIVLLAPRDSISAYLAVMNKVVESFRILPATE